MPRMWLCGFVGCAWIAGSAFAQTPQVDVEVSGAFYTRYIWNGFDRIENLGLDAGPVVQPRVSMGMEGTPLRAHVAGSFVVNEQNELHEMIYGVHVARSTSPMARLMLGYNYYDDRVSRLAGAAAFDGHEIWGAMEVTSALGARTRAVARYEMPSQEGFDAYTVVEGTVTYGLPLVPLAGVGGFGADLDVHTSVLYNTAVNRQGVEVIPGGVGAWQVGIAARLKTGRVVVTPSLDYQLTFEDALNDENPLWGGVQATYAF